MELKLDAALVIAVLGLVVAMLAFLGDQAVMPAQRRSAFRRTTGSLAIVLGAAAAGWGALSLADGGAPHGWRDIDGKSAATVGVGVVVALYGVVRFIRSGVSADVKVLRTFAASVERRMAELDAASGFDISRYVPLKVSRGRGFDGPRLDATSELSRTPGGDPRILWGPPGSGKSVLLRRVAAEICQRVGAKRRPALMAIYLDLRDLDGHAAVTVDVLRQRLEETVARGDSAMARRFTDRLQEGLDSPRWLLLFDSLDELAAMRPEAADECLTAVRALCDSDSAFTAVVATRDLDIVNRPVWPELALPPLSESDRRRFGRKAGLDGDELKHLARLRHYRRLEPVLTNPLLLGLLCDHLREDELGPALVDGSALLDQTVRRALSDVPEERAAAAMRSAQDLAKEQIEGGEGVVEDALNPLISARILRRTPSGGVRFAHNVIRDHFAASGLARDDARWDARSVVVDPAWRGAAASVLRQGEGAVRTRLLTAIQQVLAESAAAPGVVAESQVLLARDPQAGLPLGDGAFVWPREVIHVLKLVVDGTPVLAPAPPVPDEIRRSAGLFMISAFVNGAQPQQLLALDLLTLAPADVAEALSIHALSGGSRLRSTASERLMDAPLIYPALPFSWRHRALVGALESRQVGRALSLEDVPTGTPLTMLAALRQAVQAYWATVLVLLLLGAYISGMALERREFNDAGFAAFLTVAPALMMIFVLVGARWRWQDFAEYAVKCLLGGIALATVYALISFVWFILPPYDPAAEVRLAIQIWFLTWPTAMLVHAALGFAPQGRTRVAPQWSAVRTLYPFIRPYRDREVLIALLRKTLKGPGIEDMLRRAEAGQLSGPEMLRWFLETPYPESGFIRPLTKRGPEVIRPLEGTLSELVRAMEHVRRMVPAQASAPIPGAVWDLVRPPLSPEFRDWLVTYDHKYPGRLCKLVVDIYDDLSDAFQPVTARQENRR